MKKNTRTIRIIGFIIGIIPFLYIGKLYAEINFQAFFQNEFSKQDIVLLENEFLVELPSTITIEKLYIVNPSFNVSVEMNMNENGIKKFEKSIEFQYEKIESFSGDYDYSISSIEQEHPITILVTEKADKIYHIRMYKDENWGNELGERINSNWNYKNFIKYVIS